MSKRNLARNYGIKPSKSMGQRMQESEKIRTVLDSSETRYALWKKRLIEYTNETLLANGIQPDYIINDIAARECFESGMSPELTFRENFRI